MYLFQRLFNPDRFQGKYKHKNYFEGWYYKLIDENQQHVLAVIPGVAYGKNKKDHHAFIQIIDGLHCATEYITYNLSDFKFASKDFKIWIGDNYFDRYTMDLNVSKKGLRLKGHLTFHHIVPYPKTLLRPGIMGYYSFVPFMECYHGIVNIHHEMKGNLTFKDTFMDFSRGYGYIEKDWGRSFPQSWIWLQSNHFPQKNVSFMFSIAKIPWFHTSFTGFLSFLRVEGQLYQFATYTHATIKKLSYDNRVLSAHIDDGTYDLYLEAQLSKGGLLKAPNRGLMDRDIIESITSIVDVRLYNKNKDLLFRDRGGNTGMEIAGDISQFMK